WASRPCPACKEMVRASAIRCPFCGQYLDDDPSRPRSFPARRYDWEPHRGSAVLALGVVSVALAPFCVLSPVSLILGLAAWIMGQGDLTKMQKNLMDPDGMSNTRGGMICGIIGTLLSALILFFWALRALS